jgi:probable rRNA maturation factor
MIEINNTTKQRVNEKSLTELAAKFLRVHKRAGYSLSIAIIGDAGMRRLNRNYRGKDKTTDVLSFGAADAADKAKYLGEIVLNIREAARTDKYAALWREIGGAGRPKVGQVLDFLLVHGLLHLIGYDDATEKERLEMLVKGRKFLEKIYKKYPFV